MKSEWGEALREEQPSIANLLARDESIRLRFDRISGDYTHTVPGGAGDKIDAFLAKYDNIAQHAQSGALNDRVALERVLADWYFYMDPLKYEPKAAGYVAEVAQKVFGEDGSTLRQIEGRKAQLEYIPERTYTGAAAKLLTGLLFSPIVYRERVARDRVVAASIEQVARDRKILDDFDGLVRDYTVAANSFSGALKQAFKRDVTGGDVLSFLTQNPEDFDSGAIFEVAKKINRVSESLNAVVDALEDADSAYDSVRAGSLVSAMSNRSVDAVRGARKAVFSATSSPELAQVMRAWDELPEERREAIRGLGLDFDGFDRAVDGLGWRAADFEASAYLDASALRAEKVARLVKAASSPNGDADDMASMMRSAIEEMGAFKNSDSMIFTVGQGKEAGLDYGGDAEAIFDSLAWGRSLDSVDQRAASSALRSATAAIRSLDEMASSPDPAVVERYKKSKAAEAREHLDGFIKRLSAVNGLELEALRTAALNVYENVGQLDSGNYLGEDAPEGAASSLEANRMPIGSVIFMNAADHDGVGSSSSLYFASYSEDSDAGRRAREDIRVFESTLESTLRSFHVNGDLDGEVDVDAWSRARAFLESPQGEQVKTQLVQMFDMATDVSQAGLHGLEDATGALRELTPEEEKAREQMQKKIAAAVRKVLRSLFGGPQSIVDEDMEM